MACLQKRQKAHTCNVKKCKAWCCRYVVCDFTPFAGLENDNLFFALRGIKIDVDFRQLLIPCRCRWLNEHNRCKYYAQRPKSCVVYQCEELKAGLM